MDKEIKDIINNDKSKFTLFLIEKAKELINKKNEDKINNDLIINDEKNKEANVECEDLVNYMKYKRTDKIIKELNYIINSKKLMII